MPNRIYVGTLAEEKFRAAATEGLLIRSGIVGEKSNDLASYSLAEMARECLRQAGQPEFGYPMDIVGRALMTSDFPNILGDAANKSLCEGFDTAEETWPLWCGTKTVPDFKVNSINKISGADDLSEVPEHGEYSYGDRVEGKETFKLATYGKIFTLTRQAIINDDINALTDIPRAHGEAAARKLGDIAYAVLTENSSMADGISLFHTDHSNISTANDVPNVTTLAAAIASMRKQNDISGKRRLNIRPKYLIAPVALEGSSEVMFKSEYFDTTDKSATRANPYAGNYFSRIYDPRLDDNSPTAWYLAGAKEKTVVLIFLNGVQKPYLDVRDGWSVDGAEYKVRMDAAAKALDHRALYKNPGV